MRIRSNEKTCPVCGKIFTIPALKYYTYKRTRQGKPIYLCSWTCFEKDRRRGRSRLHGEEDLYGQIY